MANALVDNAASETQVERAPEKQKSKRERHLNKVRSCLATREGRAYMWHLMTYCGVFETLEGPSGIMQNLAGKQGVGHFLMKEIIEADESAYLQMQKEAMEDAKNG